MHYISCTSNLSCGFNFGTIGNVAVVTESVLDPLCKKIDLFLEKRIAVLLRLPYYFTSVHPVDQGI